MTVGVQREAGAVVTHLPGDVAGILENRVVDREVTELGTKYVVEGPLVSPEGRNPGVRSVWVIDPGEQRPRFVTAYPT